MDVLFVGNLPPHPGGTAIVGSNVLSGLLSRGHRVTAVAPLAAGVPDPGDADRYAGAVVRRYPLPAWELRPGAPDQRIVETEAKVLPAAVEAVLDRIRPDVAILGRESFARLVPPLLDARGVPMVLLAHASSGAGALNGAAPPDDRRRLVENFRRASVIVVIARNLEHIYRPLGVPVEVIQNGVDVDRFAPRPRDAALAARYGIGSADVVAGHVSNLKDLKRPLDLVASAELALPRAPSLRYLIVGDGPLLGAMEDAVAAARIGDRFRFTRWVDHREMHRYVALMDIVMMPSEREALALACLEAMAMGRALVASDLASSREVVSDGETGFLHPPGDIGAMADRTVELAGDDHLRRRIGRAARTVAEAFSLTRFMDRLEAVLRRVAVAKPSAVVD